MSDNPEVRGCVLPLSLHYSVGDHTWIRLEDDGTALIGMTDVAQNLAGPLLHAKPKKVGATRKKGKPVATVESSKWVGPVKSPISGEVIEDYSGFAKSHSSLAFLMLLFLFSLAGIPPTAGFFAKFYVLVALVEQGFIALAVIAVLLSAVAAYFYIRIVMVIYMREPSGAFNPALTPSVRIALAITAAGTIGIGVFPAWFLGLAQQSVFGG